MQLLKANPEPSQFDLAAYLNIGLGSLNYCLNAMINKGFVKLASFQNSKHKYNRYGYILTLEGMAQKIALISGFLRRKILEHEPLKAEIEGLEKDLAVGEPYGVSQVFKPYFKEAK
jgi:EPS-associated MarR family transcriptional regulator